MYLSCKVKPNIKYVILSNIKELCMVILKQFIIIGFSLNEMDDGAVWSE